MTQQMKLARIGLFFVLVQIAALFFYYVENIAKRVGADANYEFGIFLPVISLLFYFLAIRGIQKDIKLIRSADRLR
jgi:NADH:ubiquinone oxidoreductase subunit 3 (subunit A)